MIVKVLKRSIEHNGKLYVAGEKFEIEEKDYKEIEKFVSIEKQTKEIGPEVPENNAENPEQEINFSKMTVPELKKYAVEKGIALTGKSKAEIIEELEKYE
ncbi:SAP domain-containing protein [Fusobacterium ulcerans]|uniref:SAP domain-containing protein n=1 Tax=Fusobacterium ulcerans TaxID=861 RepID=UPI0026EEB4FE|nr:SAP domain-containing protein [Fusobacterium ulcerans]